MPAFATTTLESIELPRLDNIPAVMPKVIDATTLAHSLNIRTRTLTYLIVKRELHYKIHTIPKKSGGTRTIHAPSRMMKYVQGKFLENYLNVLEYPEHIAAYVPGRTTRFSAEKHVNKDILIVMDLKDFFPSTRRAWIRQLLHTKYGYSHYVAGLMADLCTVPFLTPNGKRYVVPQGAPTSGAICNWVAHHRIDLPILDICAKWDMSYTRYADDLAFSADTKMDRGQVNRFIKEIMRCIKKGGYTVNYKKLRVARYNKQQRLLGMTINEKPNIMRLHYRRLRARIHNCKTKGFDAVAQEMGFESGDALRSNIEGTISYYHMINPEKAAKLKAQLGEINEPLLHSL